MASKDPDLQLQLDKINDALKKLETTTNSVERSEQLKTIKELTKAAEEYARLNKNDISPELKDQLDTLKENNTQLSSMLLVNKGIVKTFKDMSKESRNFAASTSEWFKKGEELAKQYSKVAKNIGLSDVRTRTLSRNFNQTVDQAMKLGIGLDGVREIFDTFAEETGRARILSEEEGENIAKIAAGTGLYASEASKLAEQFDLMGVSSEKTVGFINEAIGSSREMGLNSNKVIKTLQTNMKTMQQYSFAGGVRGMTSMAKQAVKMRVDVSEVLQMADKFYQPEAAIEAAANLQMLGGDIAKAFGDPFETMYMARNKPEELANKLEDMTKNMLQFNEESGRYELPAEARMQLKAAGDQLGINTEKMVEMARQSSKINDLKMKFTAIGDNEMKENLASLAKFSEEKGEFVIQHNGEELGLDEVNESMVDEIMKANANEGKTDSDLFKNIAINTQTMSEQLQSLKESGKAAVAGGTDLYEITAENMKKTLVTPMKNTMDVAVKQFQEAFKPGALFESDEWTNATNEFGETMGKMGDELNDFINNLPKIPTNTGPGNTNNTGDPNSGPGNTGDPTASVTKNQNINLDVAINGTGTFTPEQLEMIKNQITQKIVNGIEAKSDGKDIELILNIT